MGQEAIVTGQCWSTPAKVSLVKLCDQMLRTVCQRHHLVFLNSGYNYVTLKPMSKTLDKSYLKPPTFSFYWQCQQLR